MYTWLFLKKYTKKLQPLRKSYALSFTKRKHSPANKLTKKGEIKQAFLFICFQDLVY